MDGGVNSAHDEPSFDDVLPFDDEDFDTEDSGTTTNWPFSKRQELRARVASIGSSNRLSRVLQAVYPGSPIEVGEQYSVDLAKISDEVRRSHCQGLGTSLLQHSPSLPWRTSSSLLTSSLWLPIYLRVLLLRCATNSSRSSARPHPPLAGPRMIPAALMGGGRRTMTRTPVPVPRPIP